MRILTALLLLSALLTGCGDHRGSEFRDWMQPNQKVKVLTTIAMIQDLVKQVGGEHVDTISLISGDLDPHSYQLVKGDDEKLAFAQLIFSNGLGLEHGPSLREYLRKSAKAYALGDLVRKGSPSLILEYNGTLDPHIWMDISLWAKTVPYIVQALSEKDPAHAAEYRANGEALQKRMLQKHEEVRQTLQAVPDQKRYLVTSHDAFNYFARAYLASREEDTREEWQERFAAPEGLAPESQLSTTDIQLIIDHLKKYQVHVLFPEANVSRDSIRKIEDAGSENGMELEIAKVYLYGDSMGSPGSPGETYLLMIEHNAKTIASYLNGKHGI